MSTPNPPARRRAAPTATVAAPQPRTRVRQSAPATPDHGIYEPYDGPPVEYDTLPNGKQVQKQKPLTERVDSLAKLDKAEAEDLILQTLHQFILAKTPADVIMQRMNINAGSLRWLREKLNRRIREKVSNLNAYDYIGPMLSEYEEIKAAAWREMAVAPSDQWARRFRAMEMVLKANGEIGKVLQLGGMFDGAPLRGSLQSEDESGGADVLKQLAHGFLTGTYSDDVQRKSLRPGDAIVEG